MLCLYPLYALSELAIISTDLAELLGSAIGLVLLFPGLPLPAAVLLTAVDVIFILGLGDSNKGRPVKIFEFLVIVLVSIFLLVIRLQALETLLHLSFPLIISLTGFCVNLLKKPC